MNRTLSLEQRAANCAATQEVEFIHATHTYLHAIAHSTEEWSSIWSEGGPDPNRYDTASWAHSFGRMRGWNSIWNGSVTMYDAKAFMKQLQVALVMPETGGMDPRSLYEMGCHSLATDIIEVADDGLSARAFFLTPGISYTATTENLKRRSGGLWERYGADFVFEDNRWLFLHEQVCPDIGMSSDFENMAHEKWNQLVNPGIHGFGPGGPGGPGGSGGPGGPGGPGGSGGPGGPSCIDAPNGDDMRDMPQFFDLNTVPTRPDCEDKGPLHYDWTPIQPVQNTVPWPEPYATLDNENSYTKNK